MSVTYNEKHFRVRSARIGRWFEGGWIWLWRLPLIAGIAGVAAGVIVGDNSTVWLSLAITMFVLPWLLWNRLYIKTLAPEQQITDETVRLELVGDTLALRYLRGDISPQQAWSDLEPTWPWKFIVYRLMLSPGVVGEQLSDRPQDMAEVLLVAKQTAQSLGHNRITPGSLVAALILAAQDYAALMAQAKLAPQDLIATLDWQYRTDNVMIKLQRKRSFGGIARDWAAGYTPLLNRFAQNISAEVEHGAYQYMYLQTHSDMLGQILAVLGQGRGSAVALVGGTGAGKTSMVYSLAERLLDPHNKTLPYHKIFSLNTSLIVSEAKRIGNLESLLLHIVAEARAAGNIILFFDDARAFFTDESGAVNIGNVLMQILRSRSVRMVLAMRPEDWQKLSSYSSDIAAQIQQLNVGEPDQATVEKIVQDQTLAIEGETGTTISYLAVREAYRLADRYQPDQAFPGKAINLLKTAAIQSSGGWVTPETVQACIESTLGVKTGTAGAEEADTLLKLEEKLHERMINQDFAVRVVSDSLRRARAGVRDQKRPVGSFLFLGPTGVGKTELTKALAATYFGDEKHMIRLDMSEYNRADSVQRLLAPAGDPGTFLSRLRREPFSVVLLDEIEKASPEVLNLMLQMLDEGRLTDIKGKPVSFRDAIVISTSNAGADIIRKNIDEGRNLEDFSHAFADRLIEDGLFRPELINRFDEVVLFRPLSHAELEEVVGLLLKETNDTLAGQKVEVELSPDAVKAIVLRGYDPRLGARPMRRMMQRTVENVVAKGVLSGELQPGSKLSLSEKDLDFSD